MRIVISPAKKMNIDLDSFAPEGLPLFLPEAERLKEVLQKMTPRQLQTLWRCSDTLAAQNVERLADMDLRRNLTPAILAYDGIQYRYMAPNVMEQGQLDFLQAHLRILSGFYGLLRPFDGVIPYRLEMQAGLSAAGHRDLYGFWGDRLARSLREEAGWILNLASREYSRAVEPHLPPSVRFLTCVFGEEKDGKVVEKGTMCKMARGEMVRFLAEHDISRARDVRDFDRLGYHFSPARSTENHFVFIK